MFELDFEQMKKKSSLSQATNFGSRMHILGDEEIEDILRYSYALDTFNRDKVMSMLDYMKPENALTFFIS